MKTYLSPLQPPMVIDGPINPERHALEPPEREHDRAGADSKDDPFRSFAQSAGGEHEVVDQVGEHEDGEVECRELIAGEDDRESV